MKRLLSIVIGIGLILSASASYAKERIVVAGGSLTEIIYALGAGDEIVGVDLTSKYPKDTQKLPQIGYWKLLNIEGILSLKPTLFITWKDSEPATIFKQVEKANVKQLALTRVPSNINQLIENINLISKEINRTEEAKILTASIQKKMSVMQQKIAQHTDKPNVLFLLSMGNSMVAGKNTVADEIITLAGGHNIAVHDSYITYSAEALIKANPHIIVMTSQSVQKLGGIANLAKIPGFEQTDAWKNRRIVTIDQSFILGMGPRVDQAVDALYKGFHD